MLAESVYKEMTLDDGQSQTGELQMSGFSLCDLKHQDKVK